MIVFYLLILTSIFKNTQTSSTQKTQSFPDITRITNTTCEEQAFKDFDYAENRTEQKNMSGALSFLEAGFIVSNDSGIQMQLYPYSIKGHENTVSIIQCNRYEERKNIYYFNTKKEALLFAQEKLFPSSNICWRIFYCCCCSQK